jgi:hypothetical protein
MRATRSDDSSPQSRRSQRRHAPRSIHPVADIRQPAKLNRARTGSCPLRSLSHGHLRSVSVLMGNVESVPWEDARSPRSQHRRERLYIAEVAGSRPAAPTRNPRSKRHADVGIDSHEPAPSTTQELSAAKAGTVMRLPYRLQGRDHELRQADAGHLSWHLRP